MEIKRNDVYTPLLKQFCKELSQYKSKIEIPGLFLPHVMPNYDKAIPKYFYVGRDTNQWSSFERLLEYYESRNLYSYIENENNWPKDFEDILNYTQNKHGEFWTIVCNLHLKLHGVQEIKAINSSLSREYKLLISDIGYGNLNSLETPKSLMRRDEWEYINQEIYLEIKKQSYVFDKLKYILDLYHPDYLFIFNWEADENRAFKGLETEFIVSEHIPHIISTYQIHNYKTKIIWTIHPNHLRFKGMNIKDLIEIIIERV